VGRSCNTHIKRNSILTYSVLILSWMECTTISDGERQTVPSKTEERRDMNTHKVRYKSQSISQLSNKKMSFCISYFLVRRLSSRLRKTPWVCCKPQYTPRKTSTTLSQPTLHRFIIVSCLAQIPIPDKAQYQLSPFSQPIVSLSCSLILAYSTVTDLAKFLGKSTLRPSATASQ
jgi:hypothetical protein